jgi:hypothetical protein
MLLPGPASPASLLLSLSGSLCSSAALLLPLVARLPGKLRSDPWAPPSLPEAQTLLNMLLSLLSPALLRCVSCSDPGTDLPRAVTAALVDKLLTGTDEDSAVLEAHAPSLLPLAAAAAAAAARGAGMGAAAGAGGLRGPGPNGPRDRSAA